MELSYTPMEPLLYHQGIQLAAEHHYAAALACFKQISPEQVEPGYLYFYRGDMLANLGHYAAALTDFDHALDNLPDHPEIWVARSVTLLHLQAPELALQSCQQALTLAPADPEAWLFRAVALQRLGRYTEAYASYARVTGEAPSPSWLQRINQRIKSFLLHLFGRSRRDRHLHSRALKSYL